MREVPMLKIAFRCVLRIGLLALIIPLLQCASSSKIDPSLSAPQQMTVAAEHAVPSFEQQVAGEILAYMMQVVLGKAGDPRMRDAWYNRAVDTELNFDLVSKIMTDPQMDVKQILVLDNNILGLSNVLYYYNQRLNLFKGEQNRQSLFPSVELLSLRMLLLQKIHRGEHVNMSKLFQQKAQLVNSGVDAADIDSAGTGLNLFELKLLKDVVAAEPFFMDYLENPFVVDTLYRVGVVSLDDVVKEKIGQARYTDCGCPPKTDPDGAGAGAVRIAILPSITKAFEYQQVDAGKYPCGAKPTEEYIQASRMIQDKILNSARLLVRSQMLSENRQNNSKTDGGFDALADRFVRRHVDFINLDARPFVIYPENAEKVISGLCPETDFSVIVLGENVYLSFDMREVDIYPHVNRVYLDIMDIRHAQVDYELSQVSMFIFNRLKDMIPAEPSLPSAAPPFSGGTG
jgi:hypothetical protein